MAAAGAGEVRARFHFRGSGLWPRASRKDVPQGSCVPRGVFLQQLHDLPGNGPVHGAFQSVE
eukprot:2220716-Heterocapsa_arctica.AAC.1